MAKNKHKDGPTKAEVKALEKRERAIVAELNDRVDNPKSKGKGSKSKAPKQVGPDLSDLKRKALKALIADKTNGKLLRNAAKAELAERDAEPALPPAHGSKAAKVKAKAAKPEKVKPNPADDVPVKPAKPAPTEVDTHREVPVEEADNAERIAHLQSIIDDIENNSQLTRDKARKNLAKLTGSEATPTEVADMDDTDAAIKAKRAERAASGETADPKLDNPGSARNDDALEGESEVDYQWRKAHEKEAAALKPGKPKRKAGKDELTVTIGGETLAEPKPAQVVEEVETEKGRVFAAGEADDEPVEPKANPADARGFALPSEAALVDYEVNGNGQYKVKRPSDGKTVGYTRVTTYIGTNEDRTLLEKWKLRILLEGVALNDTPESGETFSDPVVSKVRDLIHVRDLAIAKARKKDRKGDLAPGQYGTIVDSAWSAFKRALDELGESLLELGGVHVKAAKGTELHELTELYDRKGIDAVGDLLLEGKITNADLADVEAYARAIEAAGIKILPEYIETPVVIHDEKIAGRLDRIVMARMPGSSRAAKYVFDTKTGRIDLGGGKIAQQLEKYSKGVPYDLETGETLAPHGASRTKGLVLHLVPGSAEAHIYVVDLGTGRVGNDLSGKVRAFRNDGKRAIDMTVDLANPGASA